MNITKFVYFTVDGHLSWFHFSAVIDSTSFFFLHFKRMNFISQNCYKNVTRFSSTIHHFLSAHSVMHCARLLDYTDEGDKHHLFPPRASSLGVKGTQMIKLDITSIDVFACVFLGCMCLSFPEIYLEVELSSLTGCASPNTYMLIADTFPACLCWLTVWPVFPWVHVTRISHITWCCQTLTFCQSDGVF